MSNYRRARVPGGTYFFTVVTWRRRPILASPNAIATLRKSISLVHRELPFMIDAWVVLPDHMHAIWTLPDGDSDYSRRWGRIKAEFTHRAGVGCDSGPDQGTQIWQPRFWEHLIRDERDAITHMNYVHYNPVKHNLVARVEDWPYSSFHRYVRKGLYPADWGQREPSSPKIVTGE